MATQTSGPWEQYSSQTPEHGPWEEYASATPSEAELKAPPLNTEGIQISPHPGATIGPGEPASPANNFEGSGKFRGANPFERYMDEAENLTYEGAKQHPIQNFIGQTAKRGREFGNILSTMGMLFMGPGGTAPAEGVAPPAARTPVWKGQVPGAVPSAPESPANAISTPQEHIWHPANPKVEGPLTEEGNLSSGPSAEAAQPAAGPQREPTMKDLGQQIEQAAGYDRNAPIYRRPQGTVGAQTVGEQPNIEVAGPRIQTPSRNETLTENFKNRVAGSNPVEKGVPLAEQPESPARTPAQVQEETVHPMDRQFIHVNGAQAFERTAETPALREDLLNLEGDQLREVLRKSGQDMSEITSVGKSAGKAARGGRIVDPTNISRQEAFDILFEKGYTPEQIVKEAPPRSKLAPTRIPFGPKR